MNKRLILASALLAFVGCSSGGGITSTPQPPAVVTEAASFSTTSSTVTLPKILSPVSGSVTFPAGTAATTGTLTFESTLPSGVSAPSAKLRAPASIGGTDLQTLAYVAVTVAAPFSFATSFGFDLTFAKAPTGSIYIASYDENNPANGWNIVLGPGGVVAGSGGDTVTLAPQPLVPPTTFVPGDTYLYAIVESSAAIAPATSTASYTGTKTVNYVYGYDFGYPTPDPSATAPPTTLSSTVATTVSVGSAAYPGPSAAPAGLTDENVAETDTGSLSSSTFTTDSWVGETLTNGTYALSLYGTLQKEPTSAELPTYQTVFSTPQLLDQYPETSTSWTTNSPASAITYTFADGDSGTRTVKADGSYVDTENLINTTDNTVTLTENSDGSGSITGPYFGGDVIASITFSAPSGGNITNTFNYTADAQTNDGVPPSSSIEDPTWYTAPPFYTETDTVTPAAALPAGCSTTFGATGTEVQRVMTTTDTVIGDIETTTLSSYAIGNVPVCLVSNDVVNYAYDEQGNTPYLIYLGQLGLEVVTTNETLNLAPGATSALPAAKTRSATSVVPGPAGAMSLVALENHELTSFHKARLVHEHAFLAGMKSRAAASFKAVHGGVR